MVFGAAGAVGSDLVGRLAAQQGARVIASDRDHSDLDDLSKAVRDATIVPADTQDPDAVRTSPSLDFAQPITRMAATYTSKLQNSQVSPMRQVLA